MRDGKEGGERSTFTSAYGGQGMNAGENFSAQNPGIVNPGEKKEIMWDILFWMEGKVVIQMGRRN